MMMKPGIQRSLICLGVFATCFATSYSFRHYASAADVRAAGGRLSDSARAEITKRLGSRPWPLQATLASRIEALDKELTDPEDSPASTPRGKESSATTNNHPLPLILHAAGNEGRDPRPQLLRHSLLNPDDRPVSPKTASALLRACTIFQKHYRALEKTAGELAAMEFDAALSLGLCAAASVDAYRHTETYKRRKRKKPEEEVILPGLAFRERVTMTRLVGDTIHGLDGETLPSARSANAARELSIRLALERITKIMADGELMNERDRLLAEKHIDDFFETAK